MAASDLAEVVRSLEALDLEGLRVAWRQRYGPPPKTRSPEFLRLSLAWRIQAAALGGLDAATRRRLREIGAGTRDHVSQGLTITKRWRGDLYKIERVSDGYDWQGRVYSSLSAVALAMTGVKRNGPRFFGLREEAST